MGSATLTPTPQSSLQVGVEHSQARPEWMSPASPRALITCPTLAHSLQPGHPSPGQPPRPADRGHLQDVPEDKDWVLSHPERGSGTPPWGPQCREGRHSTLREGICLNRGEECGLQSQTGLDVKATGSAPWMSLALSSLVHNLSCTAGLMYMELRALLR